jgi:2-keto-3-deoxy-L-rhamnonate aldolase RhmA
MELGHPGELGHPKVVAAYERIIAAAKRHGKWAGMGGVYVEDLMSRYIAMGCQFILGGADFAFVLAAATQRTKFLRGLTG